MRKCMWFLAILIFIPGCEKKQPAKESLPDQPQEAASSSKQDATQVILEAAISARGGIDKLKAAASWTAKTKGEYMGMAYTAINHYRPGELRMDLLNANGNTTMSMLFGLDRCWSKMGLVVVPCDEKSKQTYREMMAMDQAAQLWPLKEKDSDWQIVADKEKVDIKEYDVLKVKSAKLGVEGSLLFDPQNHHLVRVRYNTSMMGKQGEIVNQLWEVKDFCGVRLAHKVFTTFANKPYMNEEFVEVSCQAPDQKLFEQPPQVTDGTLEEKTTEPMVLACNLHKGPYRTLSESIGNLTGLMQSQQLAPMGPPIMTYLKAPPKVKKPKKYVTEICFPVAEKAPEKPKKIDELTIKELEPMRVIAIYGLGDYTTKSAKLAKKLLIEAKKRKLRPAGPVSQISYLDPTSVPVDQLVSEMRLPVKAGKKIKSK